MVMLYGWISDDGLDTALAMHHMCGGLF